MQLDLRFRSGFALRLRLGLGFGLSAAVGIPTIIDRAPPVRRLLSLVVHSISGICEQNTICHVEKPTFTSNSSIIIYVPRRINTKK